MFCTLNQRLSSLAAGAWGANTFPMHKQLSNPHFSKSADLFLVFLTFPSNKSWWRLRAYSFRGTRIPRVSRRPPAEG